MLRVHLAAVQMGAKLTFFMARMALKPAILSEALRVWRKKMANGSLAGPDRGPTEADLQNIVMRWMQQSITRALNMWQAITATAKHNREVQRRVMLRMM